MRTTSAETNFLDQSFIPVLAGSGAAISAFLLQPDGKLLVAGKFDTANGLVRHGVARFNRDGTTDFGFDAGVVTNVMCMARQTNGDILVGGFFTAVNNLSRNCLVRLKADGRLDLSFDAQLLAGGDIRAVAVQNDGKIVVGGLFTSSGASPRRNLARLNSDGSLDATLNPGSGPDSSVQTMALQQDQRIIIGGGFQFYNNAARPYIARLNSDGSLDDAFAASGGPNSWVYSMATNGPAIAISGSFTSVAGVTRRFVAILDSNGNVDSTFDPGVGPISSVNVVAWSENKLLICGWFWSVADVNRSGIARLDRNGALDLTFNATTNVNSSGTPLAIRRGGEGLVVAGTPITPWGEASVLQLDGIGSVDPTFLAGVGLRSGAPSVVVTPDDSIVLAGSYSSVNGQPRTGLIRLDTHGVLDSTFNPDVLANFTVIVNATNGSLLAGSAYPHGFCRIDSKGSATFVNASSWRFYQAPFGLALQADGKVLLCGSKYHNNTTTCLQRLLPDGTDDSPFAVTFDPGVFASVNAIGLQPDGAIVIAGRFTTINGSSANSVARLNSNGTIDTTFSAGSGPDSSVFGLSVRPDGRIWLCGGFARVNTILRAGIARLLAAGLVDMSFDPGSGFNGPVRAIWEQADGRLWACGDFDSFNGTSCRGLARLNTNGTLDRTFSAGTGFIGSPLLLQGQQNGSVIVAGDFQSVDSEFRFGIARYETVPFFTHFSASATASSMDISALAQQPLYIEASTNLLSWERLSTNVPTTSMMTFSHSNSPFASQRFYRATFQR